MKLISKFPISSVYQWYSIAVLYQDLQTVIIFHLFYITTSTLFKKKKKY